MLTRCLVLLVDGNNVPSPIRPWHPAECGGPHRLVADVARLTRDWDCCADVVFDGCPRAGLRHGGLVASVCVLFAGRGTADVYIRTRVHEHAPGELIVVTSDRRLATHVAAAGAHVVSSESLRRALDIVCAAAHARASHRTPLSERPQALLALDASDRARRRPV
jgi:predicted RNA-binding protein with PIN domain